MNFRPTEAISLIKKAQTMTATTGNKNPCDLPHEPMGRIETGRLRLPREGISIFIPLLFQNICNTTPNIPQQHKRHARKLRQAGTGRMPQPRSKNTKTIQTNRNGNINTGRTDEKLRILRYIRYFFPEQRRQFLSKQIFILVNPIQAILFARKFAFKHGIYIYRRCTR